FALGKAECPLTRLVIHQQQEVDFLERAWRNTLALCAPSLSTAHQCAAPSVRGGITDGSEHWPIGRRVKRSGPKLQGRLQREPCRIVQPGFVVFETRALLTLADTGP